METEANGQERRFQATPPAILLWDGQQDWQKPHYEPRYFHRKQIGVWSGWVCTKDIKGWVDNVRIQLFVEKWKRDHSEVAPTNDEILVWMAQDPQDEFDLLGLAESIVKNGVRQPLVITSNGDLLDGNRRYFSALLKLREAEKTGNEAVLSMVSHLPAYVLSPGCTSEDFESVLVEENFVDACRVPWPNYIKATKVYEEYTHQQRLGLSYDDIIEHLTDRFGLKKAQVERFVKMMDFIEEFHEHHSTEDEDTGQKAKDEYEIRWKTQKYFEYFDELTKKAIMNVLRSDEDYRRKVFERLYDDDFKSFKQIRELAKIHEDRRALDIFMHSSAPDAVEQAIDWVQVTSAARKVIDNNARIASFKVFLNSLNVEEISSLDPVAVEDLREIADTVARMASTVRQA